MKNIKGYIGIVCICLMLSMIKCDSGPSDKTTLVENPQRMSFAALAAAPPDSTKITPSGDTIKYYHNTVTQSYSYPQVYSTITAKGSVTPPPVDTIVPPPSGTTYPLAFTPQGIGDPDINRPGAGFEQWHDRNDVNLGYIPKDVYYRTTWNRFEGATENSWNFSWLKARCDEAISRGQKLSFGIMSVYGGVDGNTGGVQVNGTWSAVPAYLISRMLSETPKAWQSGAGWVPNWNSPYYLSRCLALNQATYNWLSTTRSSGGILYKDVISSIDIRLYGNWGEWHSAGIVPDGRTTANTYPAGTFPTAASLKKIVDAHTQGFPDIQLSCMIAAFDAQWLNNTYNPPEIAWYVLTQRNKKGMIGWRRDQWGATDNYLTDYLKNNNRSFNGLVFKDSIVPRWKTAPVTGEPPAWNPNDYSDLMQQVLDYHPTSIGNGNYGVTPGSTIIGRVKAASKQMGYRLAPKSGTLQTGTESVAVTLVWTNTGYAPAYDEWQVVYDFIDAAGVVKKSAVSKFSPRLFIGSATVNDVISTTGLKGTYTVRLRVTEAYRGNMPLQCVRNSDNSITLKTITF